jgi:hypothetical protein
MSTESVEHFRIRNRGELWNYVDDTLLGVMPADPASVFKLSARGIRRWNRALARVIRWRWIEGVVTEVGELSFPIYPGPMGLLGIQVGEKDVLGNIDIDCIKCDRVAVATYENLFHEDFPFAFDYRVFAKQLRQLNSAPHGGSRLQAECIFFCEATRIFSTLT